MGRRYRILLAKRFADDLQAIFDHIAKSSPQTAPRMISRIACATVPSARGNSSNDLNVRDDD